MKKKLTLKQQKFVKEYLKDGNGTRAAQIAYPKANYKTASVIASENLAKPNVVKSINEYLQEEGYNVSESIKRLRKTAEKGAGVKARARDQIRADELLLKASGGFEKKEYPTTQYNFITYLEGLSFKELQKKKRELDKNFNKIVEDGEI